MGQSLTMRALPYSFDLQPLIQCSICFSTDSIPSIREKRPHETNKLQNLQIRMPSVLPIDYSKGGRSELKALDRSVYKIPTTLLLATAPFQ